jgi:hypothetical protein
MIIAKMKYVLFKSYTKGFIKYCFFRLVDPDFIKQVESSRRPIRELDGDIHNLTKEIKKLEKFNNSVDIRLFKNPNLVNDEECKQAAKNSEKIREINQILKLRRKDRFEQLIFALR